jgi:hypothetical protein
VSRFHVKELRYTPLTCIFTGRGRMGCHIRPRVSVEFGRRPAGGILRIASEQVFPSALAGSLSGEMDEEVRCGQEDP